MRSNYNGKEPCIGCGTPGHNSPREAKTKLCYPCKEIMLLGKQAKKQIGQDQRLEETVVATWYMFGSIYTRKEEYRFKGEWERAKAFDEKLRAMLTGLSVEHSRSSYRGTYNIQGSNLTASEGWTFKTGQAKPVYEFLELYISTMISIYEHELALAKKESEFSKTVAEEIKRLKNEIYNKGVEAGRDLLKQLNAGTLTLKDLEETVINPY